MKKSLTILAILFIAFCNAQYTRQPRQYGDYIQPYNNDLIYKSLEKKQSKYDQNFQLVKEYLDKLITLIKVKMKYAKLSTEQYKDIEGVFKNMKSIAVADFSSDTTTYKAVSYLKNTYEVIDSW